MNVSATYTIRYLRREDNVPVAGIIRSVLAEFGANKPGTVFFDPTTDDLFTLFQAPRAAYFVAESEGRIIGGAGVYPTAGLPEGCCELVKLYLLPEGRGRRLGKRLIEKCFTEARAFGFTSMYLETMPELSTAVGLYEKLGFRYLDKPMGSSGHFGCSIWMLKPL